MKRKILQFLLLTLARIYMRKYKPTLVAVTGNVGKTSAKKAIEAVLSVRKHVRAAGGNLNNEIGVPVAILGNWTERYYRDGSSLFFWICVLVKGLWGVIWPLKYPEVLVLEYGADRPGDIKRLTELFPPHIGVVTAVGDIPVHVEYFSDPDHVAREKSKLVRSLHAGDCAILNCDDKAVLEMRDKTRAKIITFGFSESANVRISNYDMSTDSQGNVHGISFKLHEGWSFVPVKISNSLGKAQAYAAAVAASVGLAFDIHLLEISEALSAFTGPPGRLRILKGIKGTIIIDDTYNSSPSATHIALEALKDAPVPKGGRRIAVIGDMLELGEYASKAHRATGNLAGDIADILVCVGERSKLIAHSAGNQMPKENIYHFHTSDEAKIKVQELMRKNDLVLIKGSQGIRMEKIVEEIMAEPERKGELLVRQSKKWRDG